MKKDHEIQWAQNKRRWVLSPIFQREIKYKKIGLISLNVYKNREQGLSK